MKKYCPTCGKPNPAAAKFCCSCGSGMNLSASTQKSSKRNPLSQSSKRDPEDAFEEEEEENLIISATELEYDVAFNEQPTQKETIGSIMGTGGPADSNSTKEKKGGPHQYLSEEDFLKEFKKEAGPLREGDQGLGNV